jgi:uncharacterized protein
MIHFASPFSEKHHSMLPQKKLALASAVLLCAILIVHAGTKENPKMEPPQALPKILVFSKTLGFRHASITDGLKAIQKLGSENNFLVDTTTNAAYFTDNILKQYKAVVFLSTTGNVLNTTQQTAFERYIETGGGFAGVHSATDTEYDWPWYNRLVGAYFLNHPSPQTAVVVVKDKNHPSTSMLPDRWQRFDEWYNFKSIQPGIRVLATLDETTYQGGSHGTNHPIAWYHEMGCGRSWYTALGHTSASYTEPLFLQHLLGGIKYAIGNGQVCPTLSSLTLVNATTEVDIRTLTNGTVLDLATIPGKAINIRANTTPSKIGSVKFSLTGRLVRTITENVLPYALFGDNNGNLNPWTPAVGSYTLTATPYAGANGTGTTGVPHTRSFTVVDNTPALSGLTLVNAATNKDIGSLTNGQVIDLAVTPAINIRANPGTGKVSSVRFSLNTTTNYKTESVAPFAIAGDNNAGDYYNWNIAPGQYTIKATPYSATNAGGTAGNPISVTITIRRSTSSNQAITSHENDQPSQLRVYPNPVTSTAYTEFELPSTTQVSLTLVNAAGKTMLTIYNGNAEAGVLYKRELRMHNFAKGVYNVILRTPGGKSITQQLLLQ